MGSEKYVGPKASNILRAGITPILKRYLYSTYSCLIVIHALYFTSFALIQHTFIESSARH